MNPLFGGGGGGEVRPLIRVQSVIVRMKRIQFCLERIDISYGESFFSQCSASHLSQGHIKKTPNLEKTVLKFL